jgi:hypothetical protein
MNAITKLVPLSILYTALVCYLFFFKISNYLNSPTIPMVVFLLAYILLTHGLAGAYISYSASKEQCNKYSFRNMLVAGFTMFFWQVVPILTLFFTSIFSTPFYQIWGYTQKAETILHTYFISLFTILTGIVIYYNTKHSVCGPDANFIEENVKELDKILSKEE